MEERSLQAHLKVQPLIESMSLLQMIRRIREGFAVIVLLDDVCHNGTGLPEKHSSVWILGGFSPVSSRKEGRLASACFLTRNRPIRIEFYERRSFDVIKTE